jgi:hypothetical protein
MLTAITLTDSISMKLKGKNKIILTGLDRGYVFEEVLISLLSMISTSFSDVWLNIPIIMSSFSTTLAIPLVKILRSEISKILLS